MSDLHDLILVVPSTTSNSMPALLCLVAFVSALFGVLYANKHSILAALDAYRHAKFPTISFLISNDLQWKFLKPAETSIPAAPQDTKLRLPTGSDTRPTLDEESNGLITSQPSDSRDRDKPNIDKNANAKSCNFEYPTTKEPETTDQDTSPEKGEECMNSTSPENEHIAEEQSEAVEQRITGATRSGAEVETLTSPNTPLTGRSHVRASALPATSAKEHAQIVDARVQSATRTITVTESDNDTITSEDVHPSPPDSPILDYTTRAAPSVECNAHAAAFTTKRRRRRPRSSTAQSPSNPTAFHTDGIPFQQPSPCPSPNDNVHLYRPTRSYINHSPGCPPLQATTSVNDEPTVASKLQTMAPRPSLTSGIPGMFFPTTSPKPAATQLNLQPSYSAPPQRAPNTKLPFSDSHYYTMTPKTTAFQRVSDVATKILPANIPSSPWSPFASGLNLDLGSQVPTVMGKHPSHFHQRSSSTGSILQNNRGNHNLFSETYKRGERR